MQIECMTTSAAAQVLFILTDAHLRPGRAFHIAGPSLPNPPIRFSLHVNPPAYVMQQLQGIPDISIEGMRGA